MKTSAIIRRIIPVLILLGLLLSSCSKPEPPQDSAEADTVEGLRSVYSLAFFPIAEGNDILYYSPDFLGRGNLWFYDLKTGYTAPLCGKPDCAHNTETCSAYFVDAALSGLSVYDNKLWYVAIGPTPEDRALRIYCQELDGTGRVQGRVFTQEEVSEATGDGRSLFYRGYYLKGGTFNKVIDEVPIRDGRIIAYSLEDGQRTEVFSKSFDQNSRVVIQPFDKWLYFSVCGTNVGDEGQSFTLCRWNLETRELEELYQDRIGYQITDMWADNDQVLLANSRSPEVYSFSLASRTVSPARNVDPEGQGWKFYCFSEDSMIFQKGDPRGFALRITDFSGSIRAEHVYDGKTEALLNICGGTDGKNVYLLQYALGSDGFHLLAIPLDGSEIKTLWAG